MCKVDADCVGNSCAGGFCCDVACAGPCKSCKMADTGMANGTCADVVAGKDPGMQCASTVGGTCDANGGCACSNGVPDGPETDVDCGGGPMGCKKKCDNGKTCAGAGDCGSGFCVDEGNAGKLCCDTACADDCHSCSLQPYWAGTCVGLYGAKDVCGNNKACGQNLTCVNGKPNDAPCSGDSECASGHCGSQSNKCRAHAPAGAPCESGSDCDNDCDGSTHTCN
jgi:hypothetical protein